MNKIYRLVWSSVQRAWVVAGEFAGARGKGTSSLRIAKRVGGVSGFVAAALMAFPADAWVAGSGTSSAALDNNDATNTSINGGAATGGGAIAIGQGSKAPNANNIAMGNNAVTSGAGTIAIGQSASATTTALAGAIALGISSKASFDGAIAIGTNTTSSALNTVAIGRTTTASGISSVGIGDQAKALGDGSVVLGGAAQATVAGDSGVAVGWKALSSGESAIAVGKSATASGKNSMSMGMSANATGTGGTAVGSSAISTGLNALAAGTSASAAGDNSTALGSAATSAGLNALAAGVTSTAGASNAIAMGNNAQATSTGPLDSADSSIAIGNAAKVNATNGIALGKNALVGYLDTGSIAIGNSTTAHGVNSIAMGNQSSTVSDDALAIGANTKTYNQSVAVGSGAKAGTVVTTGAVALGYNAVASGLSSSAIGWNALATATNSVALGASSTTTANLGQAAYVPKGANAADMKGTPTGEVSVGSAGNERRITNVSAGAALTDAVNVSQLKSVADEAVQYDKNGDGTVNYNSVTMGGPIYNSTTHTGGTKITNVADGTAPSDAVNFSQLTNTNNNINNIYATGTKYFHANSTGADSQALGADSIAVGVNAKVDAASINAIAMGNGATVTGGTGSVVIGNGAKATGSTTSVQIAIGQNTSVTGTNAIALGANAKASGASTMALGVSSTASGDVSVAQGYGATASGLMSNATGYRANASGTNSLALGANAAATTDNSVALGAGSTTTANLGQAAYVPKGANAADMKGTPTGEVSVGSAGNERRITNVSAGAALTDAVNVSQLKSVADEAVQYDKNGDGTVNYNSMTLGGTTYNSTTHTGGTKITNVADGTAPSDAVNFSQLTNTNNNINNIYATGTKYFHANSTGTDSSATGLDAVAIGMGAVANVARSVALGDGATTLAAVGTAGTKILGVDYAFAGTAPVGTVSIGSKGSERTLTNLAAGSLSATSTDGVNGSQLFATNTALNSVTSSVTNLDAGSVKYDKFVDGTVNYNNITLGGDTYDNSTHTGGTKITNVADGSDPSDAVNFSQLTTTNNNVTNLGDQVNNIYATGTKYFHANSTGTDSSATGTDAVAIGMGAVADVARSVALGDGAKTKAAVATTGANIAGTDYVFAGTAPVGTVSIGDAGAERTLTNLAAGSLSATSTDGINGSQLFATNSAINNVDSHAVKYDTNVDGTVNYNNITLGGDTYDNSTHTGGTKITNIADGSDPSDAVNYSQLTETNNNINNIYATGTKYFHANSTGTDSSATGIDAVAIGMGAVADVARSVALGDGAQTQTAVGTSGTTLLGVDYAFAGTSPVGTVSIGSAGQERTLTNMAAGRLSDTSTDGVNGSQLFATNTALNSITASVTNMDAGTVHYDKYVDGTVNYNSVTMGGDTYDNSTHTGGTKITNIADGSDPSDAVNFSQLTETNNNINNIYATGTKYFHANSTGTDSSATGLDAVAIGMGAVADVARSVALGDGATTQAVVATTGTTIRGTDYAFAGAAPVGTVSIGAAGDERTLTNMAAGRLSADSTDGVNGSQLYATNQAIDSLDISFTDLDNHAVKYDTHVDGTVNYNSVTMGGDTYNSTTHTGGTKITNIADGSDPSDAVNFSQLTETNNSINNVYANGTKYFHANSTGTDSSATGADAVAIGQSATASAMNSIAIGNGAEASTASSVALGDGAKTQTAVGTSGITLQGQNYAFAGTAPVGTVSVGDAGAERTITNVAAGQVTASSTDAVNGSQLYAVADAVNNIGGSITNLDNRSVKYDVNNDGTTNYNKVVMGGDTYDNSTHTGGTTITNVADGVDPSDAVNYAQLEVVSTQVTNISNGTDGMFQVNNTSNLPKPRPTGKDSTAGGAGAVASGDNSVALGSNAVSSATNSVALGANSIADRENSVSVGSAGNERQITNVAPGTSGTDAVNVNQLKSGIADANQYTDNKFGDLKNLVDGNKDKLSAGIAGAMAMASLPQPYAPGASMVSMGGGTYQNQSAVALGVSAISDNGKWVTKLSGTTNSQGDLGAAVGVGYQW